MTKGVLIVDDMDADLKAMKHVLEQAGYAEIYCADSAESGLALFEQKRPDIILIDVVLINVDGFDVCIQLRALDPKAKIIMVTGHLDAVNADKARKSGADEILEKTPLFGDLVQTIERVLGKK